MAMKSITIENDNDEILEWAKEHCKSLKSSNRRLSSVRITINPYTRKNSSAVPTYSATYDFEDKDDAAFFLLRWV